MTLILKNKEEAGLFIASNTLSLDDFLKTDISLEKHVYCCFPLSEIDYVHYRDFKQRRLLSVSFTDGHTL
ncbi:hypothetical protein, partial [Vibrio harveyi]|uniref:hypothetical protein n=1 Tax=Vibrio harveyi TaxID=669 RepID=UPI0009BBEC5A